MGWKKWDNLCFVNVWSFLHKSHFVSSSGICLVLQVWPSTVLKKEYKLEKSMLMPQINQLPVKPVGRESAARILDVFGWMRSYQKTGNTFEKIIVILYPYKTLWCQQLMCTIEGEGDRFLRLARIWDRLVNTRKANCFESGFQDFWCRFSYRVTITEELKLL